jgi:hypothetical protein
MLTISRKSVFGKIYNYWQWLKGDFSTEDHENFCHFLSVILFWTWWSAFWSHPIFKNRLRPWMIAFGLTFIIGFSVSSIVRSITIAVIEIVIGLILLFIITRIILPIWDWFWGKRYAALVYPWTITLALMHLIAFFWFNSLFRIIVVIELIFGITSVMILVNGYLKEMLCRKIEFV